MTAAPTSGIAHIGDLIVSRPEYRGGRPCIAGTGVTVGTIAVRANEGLTPEQICEQWEGALSLAQVHAALAYYQVNKDAVDAALQADDDAIVAAAERASRPAR
jgi:uncharacterized protein (DUF433 family)